MFDITSGLEVEKISTYGHVSLGCAASAGLYVQKRAEGSLQWDDVLRRVP